MMVKHVTACRCHDKKLDSLKKRNNNEQHLLFERTIQWSLIKFPLLNSIKSHCETIDRVQKQQQVNKAGKTLSKILLGGSMAYVTECVVAEGVTKK